MSLPWEATTLFIVMYIVCLVCMHQFLARRLLPRNPWISCLFGFVCIIIAPIFVKNAYFCGEIYINVLTIIFIDIYRWSYIQSQLNNVSDIEQNNKFIQIVYKNKNSCNILCYVLFIFLTIYNLAFIGMSASPNANYWPFFNLLCGAILIFTLIIPVNGSWCISQHNPFNNMYSDLTVSCDICWILLFCSFDLNFMLYSYFEFFFESLCLIFASVLCLLVAKRIDLWFSARFYTLAFHSWITCVTGNNFHFLINNRKSLKYEYFTFCNVWSVINFVLALFYTVYLAMFLWIQKKRMLYMGRNKGELLSDIDDNTDDDEASTDSESSTNGLVNTQQSEANFATDENDLLLDN